jgi:HYDIN/CFA65/VesB family protein/cellulase (glycosyl hydrolase family 5)/Big-like domain-containing protein
MNPARPNPLEMISHNTKALVFVGATLVIVWMSGCAGLAEPFAQLSVTPSSLSITTAVGSTSSQVVIAANVGTSRIEVSQATVSGSGFSVTDLTLPATLSPGQSKSFSVKFAATTSSSVDGILSIITDAKQRPVVIRLHGKAAPSTPEVSFVTLVPTSASLISGGKMQFTVNVQGATTNDSVTWMASAGMIDSSGTYIAPSTPGTAKVTATSNADPTKSASATVAVTAEPSLPPATPTPSPAPASASPLPSTFFSQNWNNASEFPSVPFGGIRLWDTHTSWEEIETSQGTYDWTNLDTWLAIAARNHKDVLYTLGRTPQWISAQPSATCYYGNDGCAATPADVDSGDNAWKGFITALVQHSLASPTAHIKYYELWNEPQLVKSWSGTFAQLSTMAKDAYSIIHTLDPSALVVGPSPTGSNPAAWLQSYYAAGGSTPQDIVAFHAYVGSNPETILSITDSIRSIMTGYGIGNEPVWVTEGSWGLNTTMTDAQQVAYLAQEHIFLWSKNVARYYWYAWGNSKWGTLWDTTNGVHPPGTAYGLLSNWLVGSVTSVSPCSQEADATWTCRLTLANGNPAEIVWNANTSKSLTVSLAFTSYQTLDNGTVSPILGNTVTIGNKPILLS